MDLRMEKRADQPLALGTAPLAGAFRDRRPLGSVTDSWCAPAGGARAKCGLGGAFYTGILGSTLATYAPIPTKSLS